MAQVAPQIRSARATRTKRRGKPNFSQGENPTSARAQSPFEGRPVYVAPSDMKKSTVLSASEMYQLTRVAYPKAQVNEEQEKRNTLRKKSEARYKNWGNTLEAQRQKKIEARQKKLEDTELAQQELDRQESVYEDRKRRECIERANNMFFQQQDNTKEFHSAMQYSKVLEERGKQIHFHRKKEEHEEMVENMWMMQEREQYNRAVEREEKEELVRRSKSKNIAQQQLRQLRVHQERMVQERKRDYAEGEKLKSLAKDALREAELVEVRRKQMLKQNNEEYVRANIEQQQLKAQRARMEKREEEKIMEYAKEKERNDQRRKAHEAEVLHKKQEAYQKMIDRQADHLSKIKAKEETRQNRLADELSKQGAERVAREESYTKLRKDQITKSRQAQLKARAEEQDREQFMEAIWAQETRRRVETMQQEAIDKERRIVAKNIEEAEYLKRQAAELKARQKLEKLKELEEAHIYKEKLREDDECYTQYAEEMMDEYRVRGRTVVPMKLTLRKQERRKTSINTV